MKSFLNKVVDLLRLIRDSIPVKSATKTSPVETINGVSGSVEVVVVDKLPEKGVSGRVYVIGATGPTYAWVDDDASFMEVVVDAPFYEGLPIIDVEVLPEVGGTEYIYRIADENGGVLYSWSDEILSFTALYPPPSTDKVI